MSLFERPLLFVHCRCESFALRALRRRITGPIAAVPEREQIVLSPKSKLFFRAAHPHQIVLFFFRVLYVGQPGNPPARLFVWIAFVPQANPTRTPKFFR
jgi:hypothetical protein